MTRTLMLLTIAAGLLIAPAAQAKTLRCDVKNTTVAASATVRVFAINGARPVTTRALYACRRPRGRAIPLLYAGARTSWSSVRIAAERYVSIVERYQSSLDGTLDISIRRVDLQARSSSRWLTPAYEIPADADVALLADGSAAIVDRSHLLEQSRVLISRLQQSNSQTAGVVDSAPSASLQELAASGSRLYWLKAGVPRMLPAHSLAPVSGSPLVGALPPATVMEARPGVACGKTAGSTMLASPSARIFFTDVRRGLRRVGENVRACRHGRSPKTILKARSGTVYGSPALAGRYALIAYGRRPAGNESALQKVTIRVHDLIRDELALAHTSSGAGLDVLPSVVLASTGNFAYEKAGRVIVVQAGSSVDAGPAALTADLAASSRVFYWVGSDGIPRVTAV